MRSKLEGVNQIAASLFRDSDIHRSSDFAKDQETLPAYPVSFTAASQIVAACENLLTLGDLLVHYKDGKSMRLGGRSNGPYACVRAAIECAANAYWIAGPSLSKTRVARSLLWELEEAKNFWNAVESNRKLWPEENEYNDTGRSREKDYEDIKKLADESGVVSGEALPKLQNNITQRLEWVEEHNHSARERGLKLTWQVCSGQAHGRRWSQMLLGHRTVISEHPEEQATRYLVALDYSNLMTQVLAASLMIEDAYELYRRRAFPRSSGESFFRS